MRTRTVITRIIALPSSALSQLDSFNLRITLMVSDSLPPSPTSHLPLPVSASSLQAAPDRHGPGQHRAAPQGEAGPDQREAAAHAVQRCRSPNCHSKEDRRGLDFVILHDHTYMYYSMYML